MIQIRSVQEVIGVVQKCCKCRAIPRNLVKACKKKIVLLECTPFQELLFVNLLMAAACKWVKITFSKFGKAISKVYMDQEENSMAIEEGKYLNWHATSPEIVEVFEDSKSIVSNKDGGSNDVYVAVGKNDLHVLRWALDHAVSSGTRIFLVHVFPPLSYISTPVGRLSRSQLSKEQVQVYIREESNKRKHLLDKYINMCNESKIVVETMLVESNASGKAILELISVANITNLVMGTSQSSFTRLTRKGLGKGEYVKKYAPQSCEVRVVYECKKPKNREVQKTGEIAWEKSTSAASSRRQQVTRNSERNFFECVCFSGKFD